MESGRKGEARTHSYEDHRHEPPHLEHFRSMLQAYMVKKGLRSTDQRRLIVETFFQSPESGVAFERRFGDGLTRYELADDEAHHDHLICVECGSITEFEEPEIEVLQEKVARRYGFELRSHKHEMYGVCPACRAKSAPSRRRGTS